MGNEERLTTSERLDFALEELERIRDSFEETLRNYEDADQAYELEYLRASSRSDKKTVSAREAEAKLKCIESGVDDKKRIARVKLEGLKARERVTRAVLDGLRSKLSAEKVGV